VAETKVTRIKASDDAPSKKESKPVKAAPKVAKAPKEKKQSKNPLRSIGGYFKGAWQELKLVRWPTRRATWGLTLAVLLFTVFIGVIIVLLDLLFNYLFELAIG
jgi:preprotein translocase SecE subunit